MHNEIAFGLGWVLVEHIFAAMQVLLSDGSKEKWKRALDR